MGVVCPPEPGRHCPLCGAPGDSTQPWSPYCLRDHSFWADVFRTTVRRAATHVEEAERMWNEEAERYRTTPGKALDSTVPLGMRKAKRTR